MSKLLDRLDRITRGTSRTLGFAPAAQSEPVPSLALLALVEDSSKSKIDSLTGTKVDALILPRGLTGVDGLEKQVKSLEGSTWGVAMDQPDRDRVEAYREKGCDFIVFGIDDTAVDALEEGEGEPGRILSITADLEESVLRGLEDLPMDIILLRKPPPEGPLSLSHLLSISNIRSATSHYLLLEWDTELTPRELEHLRDMGVDGLVINAGETDPAAITTLQEKISALPPRRGKGEQRPVAVLPRLRGAGSIRPDRQEEEEEDEEWDEP
ncbi:MAG: hypothetical protein V3S37_07860 [Dehalococcoidia bacterium]